MPRKAITQEQESQICEIYKTENISLTEIGKIFGVSINVIFNCLKKFNLPNSYQMRLERIDPEKTKAIVDMYLQGNSDRIIEEKFGLSRSIIRDLLIKEGISLRNKENFYKIKLEERPKIIERYLNGESAINIAKDYNVRSSAINHILHINNIPLRDFFTKDQMEEICNIYQNTDFSLKEIGKLFNVSVTPIKRVLQEANIFEERKNCMPFLEEYKEWIIKEYLNGRSGCSIAKELEVGSQAVRRFLKKYNIDLRSHEGVRKIKPLEVPLVIEKYLAGEDCVKIGKFFNTSKGTIKSVLLRNNIKIRGRETDFDLLTDNQLEEIINMYQDGALMKTICKIFEIDIWMLQRFFQKRNIKIRTSSESFYLYQKGCLGRGICGYYRGHFFRSFCELSFIGTVLIPKYGNNWHSGENKEDRIEYFFNGKRHYHPDFIIKNKIIIECKPKALWGDPQVIAKAEAAKKVCKVRGMKYVMIDHKININFIIQAYLNNEIELTPKMLEIFERNYSRHIEDYQKYGLLA